ncbi:MAG: pseudouridine synthase [Alphaproteobacteria bacterium]|nr:MAG: pseudouridine synthase [Alphaproteobacteria bacterium]
MTDDSDQEAKGERIAKALARAGIGSRRDIERMIADGRISLDGKTLDTAAVLVDSLAGIKVDGEAVGEVAETKLWRFHKRRGTLTTHKDPEGRPTVFDKLPDHLGRVIAVGRLDMNTEGLLLLTNDGALARWLELPSSEIVRRYRVRVHGRVDEKALKALADGATIDGIHYGSIDAKLEKLQATNAWLTVAIKEGKNREVRRVMEHLGLVVNRLIRTHYGPFSLGTLNDGAVAPVGEKQLHDVLSEFFKTAPRSVTAPEKKLDPSKWAKPKAKPVKPGTKRRRPFNKLEDADAKSPSMRKPRGHGEKVEPRGTITAKPSGKPSGKPGGKPFGKPAGGAGGAGGKSFGKPAGKPAGPAGTKPGAKPAGRGGPKK